MNTTVDSYSRCADSYAEKFMDFSTYREKVQAFQQKYLENGSQLLDLGCGPGNNAQLLLVRHPDSLITGIDLSEEMVHLARKNAPEASFSVGNICDYRAEKTYDAVLASFCIVHITLDKTEKLIIEIGKSMKTGGHLYLSFMEGQGAGYETTSFSTHEIFFQYYRRAEIIGLLERENLDVVELLSEEYHEDSGDITTDIFIFARKKS